jgi:hypothetical protein
MLCLGALKMARFIVCKIIFGTDCVFSLLSIKMSLALSMRALRLNLNTHSVVNL